MLSIAQVSAKRATYWLTTVWAAIILGAGVLHVTEHGDTTAARTFCRVLASLNLMLPGACHAQVAELIIGIGMIGLGLLALAFRGSWGPATVLALLIFLCIYHTASLLLLTAPSGCGCFASLFPRSDHTSQSPTAHLALGGVLVGVLLMTSLLVFLQKPRLIALALAGSIGLMLAAPATLIVFAGVNSVERELYIPLPCGPSETEVAITSEGGRVFVLNAPSSSDESVRAIECALAAMDIRVLSSRVQDRAVVLRIVLKPGTVLPKVSANCRNRR